MFTLNVQGESGEQADTSLLLLPTVPKVQESRPLEEVALIRDEMANMVWGIERIIPLPTGWGKSGPEAALETFHFYERGWPTTWRRPRRRARPNRRRRSVTR